MPELLTKNPDVVIQILNESGAACGSGAPQQILTDCPAERFCALPTGELCVFGLNEIQTMSQITPAELIEAARGPHRDFTPEVIASVLLAFAAGALAGKLLSRTVRKT